jgi:hypothetical protein
MADQINASTEEFQRASKANLDAVLRAWGEAGRGIQTITSEVTEYSKRAFEEATRTFEQVVGAKSVGQAFEIQSQYAKRAYDAHMAELTKLGEMYVNVTRSAFKVA